ncbi:arsenate reductase family protein [Salimicrobium halophilum]|uniref:Arsenate reductase n=1 Tax=Salimicrobium halophilum TaxID=86666 RepID=A0A1G8VAI6_9BACI|nr:arsenate reductase family protein [Salimicrobium halophilum]SDJ62180.1 arsenate reductase [Salimicrobium halophilum]
MLTFYWYPKCGTCRNAKKWLDENNVEYEAVHIVDNPPSKDKLLHMMEASDLPPKRFFNSSGKKYRELGLKDKVGDMSLEEQAEVLASDGMLIKRPLATDGKDVTAGFKEDEYKNKWL